ncbi:MAG: Tat pathway signal protein [Puniceicoccaceae bacterium]|nr:MAG: Tat pathway signal protein [Puniceicoccaceae bacterium]
MPAPTPLPWFQRVRRWGQTNLSERDPVDYDDAFWRSHWRHTRVQGIIVNAAGIVAYYPSRFERQYRARYLGGRDLFGEITAAAREEGLAVLARMDSNRADESFLRAHPDWFCVDAGGSPYQSQGRFFTCVNGPYYREFLPQILVEIVQRYHPEGFTDNSWSGLGRGAICHCDHCARRFREEEAAALPREENWDDSVYRKWIRWSYRMRLEVWDLNNRVTRDAGGEHCLWLGMLSGDPIGQSRSFRDLRSLARRSQIIMCDHQSRDCDNGFEQNALNGKLLHGLMGWDRQIPESMAMYVRGAQAFRVASNPAAESRLWMAEGFAGGISPWLHHITARHEDRRQYATAEPLMRWHEANEDWLYDREPVAAVGLVWSQENIDFHGRDRPDERVGQPWRGMVHALNRAHIPWRPVHADDLDASSAGLSALVLPDLAVMTDGQIDAVRGFVEDGGGLVATGRSSRLDGEGLPREDFGLAEVLGVRIEAGESGADEETPANWEQYQNHTYIRRTGSEGGPLWEGFSDADLLPFGGLPERVRPAPGTRVEATWVPPFPIYPPEFCWTDTPATEIPAVLTRETPGGGRVACLPADLARTHGRYRMPDHARLLANLVRWAVRGDLPMEIKVEGRLNAQLYRKGSCLVLHLVNLTGCPPWPEPVETAVPVGPVEVRLRGSGFGGASKVELRVAGASLAPVKREDGIGFTIPKIDLHEMVVVASG